VRGLASSKRSTAPSNGMDAKSSAGVPLSSPAAAQRWAEGAGLDSGAPASPQSVRPSIALPATADRRSLSTNAAPAAPHAVSNLHQLDGRDRTETAPAPNFVRTLSSDRAECMRREQMSSPSPGDQGFESLYPSRRLSAGRHCRLAGPGRPAGSRPRIPVF
jgi:hypothetical protein